MTAAKDAILERILSWVEEGRAEKMSRVAGAFSGPALMVRDLLASIRDALLPSTAEGDLLTELAADLGFPRFGAETDARLRQRIYGALDVVHAGAVQDAVNDYLTSVGQPEAVFLAWHSGHHFIRPDSLELGFAVGKSRILAPNGHIVFIDDALPGDIVANVISVLEDKIAGGFFYVVVPIPFD